jgi:predicted O-methyltransferase YrrM
MNSTFDPFSILSKYPKRHPIRIAFLLRLKFIESISKINFDKYVLPQKLLAEIPVIPDADYLNTAVTPTQMQYLLAGLANTENIQNSVVVEIGCYRGATTQVIAKHTLRKVIAIDPYVGYGGEKEDFTEFFTKTKDLSNVIHKHRSSGEAAKNWQYGDISFIFIDAVHDYLHTSFDIQTWLPRLSKGGILALHDTDQRCFSGTRKAVFEIANSLDLFAHTDNLVMFQKL